jgi:hypothetical protein
VIFLIASLVLLNCSKMINLRKYRTASWSFDEPGKLRLDLSGCESIKVQVGPGMRGNLMTVIKSVFSAVCVSGVVDAIVWGVEMSAAASCEGEVSEAYSFCH